MIRGLVKFLDLALLPFAITILAKVLGLYIVLNWLDIDWGIAEFPNSVFSVTPLVYGRDVFVVATYSNLILFFVVFLFAAINILGITLRSKSISDPVRFRQILGLIPENWLQKGYFLHTRSFVWVLYLWLVTVYIIIDSMFGRTHSWLLVVSSILSAAVTIVFLVHANHEFETISKKVDMLS